MRWREKDGVRWLQAELPGATAVFSTRLAGSVKDDPLPLAAALGIAPERIATSRQVHGSDLITHGSTPFRCAPPTHEVGKAHLKPPQGDGHVLRESGPVGLVYTADCLPVALAGPGGAAILHCGWRGLAAGIVAAGVEAVGATHAAVGPGIGPRCYEVGDEVLGAFDGLGGGFSAGCMLDLPEVARRLLREADVEQVESAGHCTHCEEELFFSHRRDGGPGRQAGLVWLSEAAA